MKLNNLEDFNKTKNEIHKIIFNLNSTTVCFTGHRSQKLPWGYNEEDERCVNMKKRLYLEIKKSILQGYTKFLCGMALGFDMICAEIVLQLKKRYKNIKLIGAIPCENQDCKWNVQKRTRYRNILNHLDFTRCIYKEYNDVKCMIERNNYMVNNSAKIIALYNGISGGTKRTIEYAKKQGLEIVIIRP